jgi:hypothetical protein
MIPRVIRSDRTAERRARIFASLLLLIGVIACGLWPRSIAWAFLTVPLFGLFVSVLATRRDVPRLEIFPDRLVIKRLPLDDAVVSREVIAVFAIVPMKHGEALVAFAEPPPLNALSSAPRASDTILPSGLEVPLAELQVALSSWLTGNS